MVKARLRTWGSSLGLIVPKKMVIKERLKPGEEIDIEIKKKNSIKEAFGALKDWKINPQKIKDELRKEWSK